MTVLAVDDEPAIVELYATHLDDHYDVRTATGGAAAIELLDADVDVVLLDRRMPVTSGDDVLDAIEATELDPRVAIVTAATVDFDVVKQRFDEYLVKPVTGAEIRDAVERLLLIDEYSDRRRELNSLLVRRNVLEVEMSTAALQHNDEYQDIESRIADLESRVATLTDTLEGTPLEQYS